MYIICSIIFHILTSSAATPLCTNTLLSSPCLPCPSNCLTCSSSTQCTTCQQQYYASNQSGLLACLPCSAFCLRCSSNNQCTQCRDPYVITNGSCVRCQINYASTCTSLVSASTCKPNYYVSENYCYSCLLNCQICSSNTDCTSCRNGFTINTTVLTCIPCQLGCKTCNQYNITNCSQCYSGYQLSGGSCQLASCPILNCKYCYNSSYCQQCQQNYYWSSSSQSCLYGSSLLCAQGSKGVYPTDCSNSCPTNTYLKNTTTTTFTCLPYSYIFTTLPIYQLYYYSFNDLAELIQLGGAANPLILESNNEYSYQFSQLNISNIPPYYKMVLSIKYYSISPSPIQLNATTPQSNQSQSIINNATSQIAIKTYTSVFLHSDNLIISSSNIRLIQLFLQFSLCPSSCLRCLNLQMCQYCVSPFYMLGYKCVANCSVYYQLSINRTCVVSCPNTYYHNTISSTSKYCVSCVAPCLNCISDVKCLSCVSTLFFIDYRCVNVCPSGYYSNNQSKQCSLCLSPCKSCINQTACLSCDQGYWNGSACTNSCPTGQFGNAMTFKCQPCDSSCLTCLNVSTQCTSCLPTLYFYNNQCLNNCPQKYYPSNNTCSTCQLPCLTCTSQTQCLSCSYNFLYNQVCVNCPSGYFSDIISMTCIKCTSPCLQCTSPTYCTSCSIGCLFQGTCASSCPSLTWYPDKSNIANCTCKPCMYPCKQCVNSTTCSSCLAGYLYSGSCVTQCNSGYYADPLTLKCINCLSTYQQCIQCTSSKCILCNGSLLLHSGTCVTQCPKYYYQSLNQCYKCIAPCLECSAFSTCISCVVPYSIYQGSCIIQCPLGQIPINYICKPCTSPCQNCDVLLTNCTLCIGGYYLYNNTCVLNCSTIVPLNSVYNELITSTCAQCIFPCKQCLSQQYCLSCRIGYLTNSTGKCQACSVGTFASAGICIGCPSECASCYSNTLCTSCNAGYYLYLRSCISNISICQSNGYYAIGRVCQPCRPPCSKCSITANNCTQCLSGYISFNGNLCLVECPKGYYRSISSCLKCYNTCSQCIMSDIYCLSCITPNYLDLSTMQCVQTCPDGRFTEGSVCQNCRYPCQNCITEDKCTSCVSGSLQNYTCYSSCPQNYYSDANQACQPCSPPCYQCIKSSTNCTQCQANTYLYQYQCLAACPSSYFASSESAQCLKCLSVCKQCTSQINCTSCYDDKIFFYNSLTNYSQCLLTCPISYYPGTTLPKICIPCSSECFTCANGATCILCNGGKVQYNGKCYAACPSQMYAYGGICQNCTAPCYNCSDITTCTSCIDSSNLLVAYAQCIDGPNCPVGYYKLDGMNVCNSRCPAGYYHLNNRTCNNKGCAQNEYMGADMMCYQRCPNGYLANKSFHCVDCSKSGCIGGLFFSSSYQIIRDEFYVTISFTQQPYYTTPQSYLTITPNINFTIVGQLANEANEAKLSQVAQYKGNQQIILHLSFTQSLKETIFIIAFQHPLKTFSNPIQQPSTTLLVSGYDYYQCRKVSFSSIGILALAVTMVGLVKNPYMVDFGQIIFFLSLLNIHYPCHLSQFFQSCRTAHLYRILPTSEIPSLHEGKFSYISSMSFLPNALQSVAILIIGLLMALILYVVMHLIRRTISYHKLEHESTQNHQNNLQPYPKCAKIQGYLSRMFQRFHPSYLNRIVYFIHPCVTLFSFAQLWKFNLSSSYAIASCLLGVVGGICISIYPFSMLSTKPKYAYLYIRKYLIYVVMVSSRMTPIYIVGVISVCNLSAAILVISYKLEKWKIQTRVIFIGELLQLCIQIMLAMFIMIDEGTQTNFKLLLSWTIIIFIIITLIFYLAFAIFQFILFLILQIKGIDYKLKWSQQTEQNTQQTDSQENTNSVKLQQNNKNKQLLNHLSKKNIIIEPNKQLSDKNQQLFWAYNQDQQQSEFDKPPPKMLIRCVNQFSDLDPKQHNNDPDQHNNK